MTLLGLHQREMKTCIHIETCLQMFIAALSLIDKWEQPKWPSSETWANEAGYICIVEYYSAMKMNEVLQYATTWMNLANNMLSERNQ